MTVITTAGHAGHTSAAPVRRAGPNSRPPSTLQLLRDTLQQEAKATPVLGAPVAAPEPPAPPAAAPPAAGFSVDQITALSAPLDRANVRQREQGRSSVSYLEGWQVIAEANRIFGFDGWQRQTIAQHCVSERERSIGRDQKPGWGVTYTAQVRITVRCIGQGPVIREGSGAGHGIDSDLGQAHESALKEAETDAMKRALMTFGNPFGLALYDKRQRQVSAAPVAAAAAPTPPRGVSAAGVARPATARPTPPQAETAAPLDPAVIQALQERIKALPAPRREAFARGFRTAFQVPDAQPSLAGLITTARHREWIEAFLGEGEASGQHQPGSAV
ncbi:RAD52 family DNA repair protein [Vulcanococcus limneticus]|uniref:RAD52 family DNA repair protein n=1 Tax=Vulcanococcus limneticus TaxID=2170428 RepID=UPI00398BDE33